MNKRSFIVLCMLLSCFCIYAVAQTVDEVINKNIQAVGGLEKIKAAKTIKITGKSMMQSLEIPVTMWIKKPDKIRTEVTIQGKTITQAYDGTVAWGIMPMMGTTEPELIPEEERKQLKDQADIEGPLVDYKAKGHSVELIGKEDMEGTDVFKIKVTKKNGDIVYFFIDSKNYLTLKESAKIKHNENEIEVETYLSNYKDVNGMMVPHSMETKANGQALSQFTLDTFEINAKFDDTIFKMPPKQTPEKKEAAPEKKEPVKVEKKDTDKSEKKEPESPRK